MSRQPSQIGVMQQHFESFLVTPISTCIDDLALAESARFETRDGVESHGIGAPVVLDLTGTDEPSEREIEFWASTPQQRIAELRKAYPNSSNSTLQRRLQKLLQVKPVKAFYSSHYQNSLHLARTDRTAPAWESKLTLDDERKPNWKQSEISDDIKRQDEQSKVAKAKAIANAHAAKLLHPLSTLDHPPTFKSLESKGSCISDWAWFPVLDAIGNFFSDVALINSTSASSFPSFLDIHAPSISDESRRPQRQSSFCIDSGLSLDWILPLERLWAAYPSQMLLFIEKQMVMALRDVRGKVLSPTGPLKPWTFWRRPDTPTCGTAPDNPFNPESPTSWISEMAVEDDILSPILVNDLTHRENQFSVPTRGIPLSSVDTMALAILQRLMTYWEAMKVKIKPLAQIIDTLISKNSREEYFSLLPWVDSRTTAQHGGVPMPSMSYHSYNPFSLPGQEMDLRFEWIFQLLFRTVVLRNHSVRWHLRRALFMYRQLFSLDQPQEVAEMLRIRQFEAEVRKMDENAWNWKFRLSVHHYMTSSRVSNNIKQYPILYSPLLLPLLSTLKHTPRQKQSSTLSDRWPILTPQHLQTISSKYQLHRLTFTDKEYLPLQQLPSPPTMPMEWRILRDEAMAHPRMFEVIQAQRRRSPNSTSSYNMESPSGNSPMTVEQAKEVAQLERDRMPPGPTSGAVSSQLLTSILQAKAGQFDDEWSDESDADYPDEDTLEDSTLSDEYGHSEGGSALSENSEYEYYDSDEEIPEDDEEVSEENQDEDIPHFHTPGAARGYHHHMGISSTDGSPSSLHSSIIPSLVREGFEAEIGSLHKSVRQHQQQHGHGGQHQQGHHEGRDEHGRSRNRSRQPKHADSAYDSSTFLGHGASNYDMSHIDWSKIDSELVAAVMEGSSREEIAQSIARRLGLGASQLPYEIADLIPATLMQQVEHKGKPSGSKASSSSSRSSQPNHASTSHGRESSTSSSNDTTRFGKATSLGTAGLAEALKKFADTPIEKMHPHLRPSRVPPVVRDGVYHSPFGPEAANGLVLPVPSAPPPPPQNTRKNAVLTRPLTQRFDSDDELDDDAGVDLMTTVIYDPEMRPSGDIGVTPVYPYSVAAKLHDLRMNDPHEGTTLYKLKLNPTWAAEQDAHLHAQSRPSRASHSSANSNEAVRVAAIIAKRRDTVLQQEKQQHQQHQQQNLHQLPSPNTATTATTAAAASTGVNSHHRRESDRSGAGDSSAPGINDASLSVDELLEFIEGPDSSKSKSNKKKAKADREKAEKERIEKERAEREKEIAIAKAETAKLDVTKAEASKLEKDRVDKEKKQVLDASKAKEAKATAAATTTSSLKAVAGLTIPKTDYPEFWDLRDSSLTEDQQKTINAEMEDFQSILNASAIEFSKQQKAKLHLLDQNQDVLVTATAAPKTQQPQAPSLAKPPKKKNVKGKATAAPTTVTETIQAIKLDQIMFTSLASKARSDQRNIFKRIYQVGDAVSAPIAAPTAPAASTTTTVSHGNVGPPPASTKKGSKNGRHK